jgi:hypothetical protein
MTWTPPPESERPHGYKCLALVEIYEGCSIWAEVVWQTDDVDEPYWLIPILDCDLEEPARFAPLPDEAAARIEELEAEVAEWKEAHRQACANWLEQCEYEMAKTEAAEAEGARLRMILAALDAYARGEPSQPPVTGAERRSIDTGDAP